MTRPLSPWRLHCLRQGKHPEKVTIKEDSDRIDEKPV